MQDEEEPCDGDEPCETTRSRVMASSCETHHDAGIPLSGKRNLPKGVHEAEEDRGHPADNM